MFGIELPSALVKCFHWIKIYILWITLHFVASHLYVELCTPKTVIGFLLSPILAPALHCQAIRWIVYNGGNHINTMWIMIGLWTTQCLVPCNNDAPAKNEQSN